MQTQHDSKVMAFRSMLASPAGIGFAFSAWTATFALGLGLSVCASAQGYPAKAVRMIVPYPAGGAGDMVARVLGQRLAERWGQQVVIDNRAGGGGVIGMQLTARSAPDGYTIVLCTASTDVIGPILQPDTPYDPIKDFSRITLTILMPNVLVTHPSVPVGSLPELIKLAKTKPSQLTYASAGNGTSSHISGELLKSMTGISLIHVPYKGAGQSINDLLGGQVQILFTSISTALPHIKASRLRALAVTSSRRSAVVPTIPAIAEFVPGYEVVHWFGISGPAGIPKPVVAKLNADIRQILDSQEFKGRMVEQGLDVMGNSADEFAAFVKAEKDKFTKLFKEAGIRNDPS